MLPVDSPPKYQVNQQVTILCLVSPGVLDSEYLTLYIGEKATFYCCKDKEMFRDVVYYNL